MRRVIQKLCTLGLVLYVLCAPVWRGAGGCFRVEAAGGQAWYNSLIFLQGIGAAEPILESIEANDEMGFEPAGLESEEGLEADETPLSNDLARAEVGGVERRYDYTGAEIRPDPAVNLYGVPLARDVDYVLRYSDNINIGTAKLAIEGIGDYTGVMEISFAIELPSVAGGQTIIVAEAGMTVIAPKDTYTAGGVATIPQGETARIEQESPHFDAIVPGGTTIADTGEITIGQGSALLALSGGSVLTLSAGSVIEGKRVTLGPEDGTVTDGAKRSDLQGGEVLQLNEALEKGFEFNPFDDIKVNDWFYGNVLYVYQNGIMVGVSEYSFAPKLSVTRAMAVSVLWSMEDGPTPGIHNTFTDLQQSWYLEKVLWSVEEGIAIGFGDGTFGPDQTVTREQLVVILYQYARYLNLDISGRRDLSGYDDASKIAGWALEEMQWANAIGLMVGQSESALAPKGTATRAELAAMLRNFQRIYRNA